MVVKVHLLFMIAVVSGFLLTLQLITLQYLIKKASGVDPSWMILNAVTTTARENNIPIFLVDPELLILISNSTSQSHDAHYRDHSYCQILCSGRRITHLATLAQFATQLHLTRFTLALRAIGLTVIELSDFDPTLQHHKFQVSIPLHLLVLRENIDYDTQSHVVHIIIFHERINSQYWWHGIFQLNDHDLRLIHRQKVKKYDIKVSHESSIYDKVEIIQTQIDGLFINLPSPFSNFLQSPEQVEFIECDKTRAQEFVSRFGKDESQEAIVFRSKALALLSKAGRLLDQLGIPFWLSSGTCLGYFRQCDFITYGKDVDIGIWITDYKPQMIDLFSTNDLPLFHSFGKVNDSFELSFRDGDIKLDVFFFYKEGDTVWNGGTQAKSGLKFKYTFPTFTLCWTEFFELKVRVPCQTQAYIEANYGWNWFQPVKEWDWKSSPFNVKPNGQWPMEEWDQVIQLIPKPEI